MSNPTAFQEQTWILDQLKRRKVGIADTLSSPKNRKLTIAFRDDIESIKPILLEILLRSEQDYGYEINEIDGFDVVNIYYKSIDEKPYLNLYTDVLNTPEHVITHTNKLTDKNMKNYDSQSVSLRVLSALLASYWIETSLDKELIANKIALLSNDNTKEIINEAKRIKNVEQN